MDSASLNYILFPHNVFDEVFFFGVISEQLDIGPAKVEAIHKHTFHL